MVAYTTICEMSIRASGTDKEWCFVESPFTKKKFKKKAKGYYE